MEKNEQDVVRDAVRLLTQEGGCPEKDRPLFETVVWQFRDACLHALKSNVVVGDIPKHIADNLDHFFQLEAGTHPGVLVGSRSRHDPVMAYRTRDMQRFTANVFELIEVLMRHADRTRWYREMTVRATEHQDGEGCVNFAGWYAEQLLQMRDFEGAQDALKKPMVYCEKKETTTRPVREGYAKCLSVMANAALAGPPGPTQDIVGILNKAYSILDERPTVDNVLTRANCANLLGSAYFAQQRYQESLAHTKRAIGLLESTGHRASDFIANCTYQMNMGTNYLAFFVRSTGDTDRRCYFKLTEETFGSLLQELHRHGLTKTAWHGTCLKHLSMLYCQHKDYAKALVYGLDSAAVREEALPAVHTDIPETNTYLGHLYRIMADGEEPSGIPSKIIPYYRKALSFLMRAMGVEFLIGYRDRSKEYDTMKRELKYVLIKLGYRQQWNRYKFLFGQHENADAPSPRYVQVEESDESSA